ncbi:MAG: hypothetical protein JO170_31465 [Verrucomicrobia bacterium]|nr:hypothetical protein [Verrucomicrobiota bacterium]
MLNLKLEAASLPGTGVLGRFQAIDPNNLYSLPALQSMLAAAQTPMPASNAVAVGT